VETRSCSARATARLASLLALAALSCASPPKAKVEPGGAGATVGGTGESGSTGSAGNAGTGASGGESGASGDAGAPGDAGALGTAGVLGAAGTSALATCAPSAPAPAANGAAFPFPQHRFGASCSYPANCNDADVTLAWANWKKAFVTAAGGALRVKRPTNGNDTVSEGIGYGMMAAAYMADRATLDGLWAYAKAHLDENGVMNWHYDANGNALDGGGGATDADEDIAFGLVMADAQWPAGGYAVDAKALIGHILDHEVESGTNVLKPGDRWGGSDQTNPSYLAPATYRVFASYTGDARWMSVVDASYGLLDKCANAKTGLVPDWCNADGAPQRNSHYSYDACRTPWRIAVDACWNAEPRAQAYLALVSAFFGKVGAASIKDGYGLDGTPLGAANVLAFVGPAGAGALAGPASPLSRDAYTRVKAVSRLAAGSGYDYYDASWGLLSLLMMTGNLADLTSH
jgi:endo-1,4-beta-D-glucanase Y